MERFFFCSTAFSSSLLTLRLCVNDFFFSSFSLSLTIVPITSMHQKKKMQFLDEIKQFIKCPAESEEEDTSSVLTSDEDANNRILSEMETDEGDDSSATETAPDSSDEHAVFIDISADEDDLDNFTFEIPARAEEDERTSAPGPSRPVRNFVGGRGRSSALGVIINTQELRDSRRALPVLVPALGARRNSRGPAVPSESGVLPPNDRMNN